MFYVYEHIRPDTKTVFYVGKGQGYRLKSLRDRNRHWKFIVAKAGGFEATVLVEHADEELILLAEQERIDQLKRLGYKLCNITNGGEGITGLKHTEESKKKMSESRKKLIAYKHTEESKDKIRKANTGVVFTEERKRKISEARKGKKGSIAFKEACRKRMTGFKHTPETREKMCKIQKAVQNAASCPHCHFVGNAGNVARWHMDNCKQKGI